MIGEISHPAYGGGSRPKAGKLEIRNWGVFMQRLSSINYKLFLFSLGVLTTLIVVMSFFSTLTVSASSPSDIAFPVAELGGCRDKAACKAYCDQPEHKGVCVDFADRHGLLSREQAQIARRVVAVEAGPGGCRSHTECEDYCEDDGHIDKCLEFAERENLLSGEELEEARRVSQALRAGNRLPGGCKSKAACEAYCAELDHMAECLSFAEISGLIPPRELAEAKKVLKAVQAGHRPPGGCQGKRQCESYCNAPEHMEECLEFGLAAGFLDAREAEEARLVLPLLKSGQTPGKCRSKEQCDAYCADPTHFLECAEFAVKAGFIPPEEAAMLKKVLPFLQAGQTPGKCRSREQCEAYCEDPAHRQECTDFALKAGLMSPEDLEEMQEGMERMREALAEAPDEVRACIGERLGAGVVAQIEAGTLSPGFNPGESFRECFDQFAPKPDEEFGGEGEFERRGIDDGGYQDDRGYEDNAEFFQEDGEREPDYFDDGVDINSEFHSSSLIRRVVRSRPESKIVRLLKTIIGRETVWGR